MYTLTAADFADTGQWRLIIELKKDGLVAWLENTLNLEIPPQRLCAVAWLKNKEEIKSNIEKAVYENPRLLDDFATRIIIYDADTMFIPSEFLESQGAEAELYREIYNVEVDDVMYDKDGDLTAAWSLGHGVRSFLLRTFPGARLTNHLLESVKALKKGNNYRLLHIESRHEETDFILLDGNKLICASTQCFTEEPEVEEFAKNILKAYNYLQNEVVINSKSF